jgi:hypothetical protein
MVLCDWLGTGKHLSEKHVSCTKGFGSLVYICYYLYCSLWLLYLDNNLFACLTNLLTFSSLQDSISFTLSLYLRRLISIMKFGSSVAFAFLALAGVDALAVPSQHLRRVCIFPS